MSNNLPLPSGSPVVATQLLELEAELAALRAKLEAADPDGYYRGILVGGGGPPKGEALQTELDDTRRRLGEWRERAGNHERTIAELRSERDELRRQHHDDIKRIGDRILEESSEDDTDCEMWDGIIADLNTRLHVHLPVREYDYVVTYAVKVPFKVEVRAVDDDTAEELAHDELSFQALLDYVRTFRPEPEAIEGTIEVTRKVR